MGTTFARWSAAIACWTGHWGAFFLASLACVAWAASGPLFGFSDTWQLVVNTATTVLTFLAVFVIQNTQNRDSLAIHLKLDELIRAVDKADDALMRAEDATDANLAELKARYSALAAEHDALRARLGEEGEAR